MKKLMRLLSSFALAAAMLGAVAFTADRALAIDRVVLKDGTIVEGTIVREMQGAVWIKTTIGGVPTEKMYLSNEYSKVERDAGEAAKPDAAPSSAPGVAAPGPEPTQAPDEDRPARPGVPRAVVLTMGDREYGDMVGVYMVSNILQRAIPVLEKEIGTDRTGIVVLRITSGGGSINEIQKISDVIHNEYKKRWRTVGWIDAAISAAAMSPHCLDEIYFTTRGNYGGCVGFYGSLDKPVEGFELEKVLAMMEKISARGGHDPLIMRAMQVQQPLSAHIDENGQVHWYPDAKSGEIVVNRDGEILTFDAEMALKVKFSKGTADTLPELTRAMGYQEIDWVGKQVRGSVWPISKAEQMQIDFRRKVHYDEENFNRYQREYGMYVGLARQAPREERPPLVGKARQSLDSIKSMVRNNPAYITMFFRDDRKLYQEWIDEQEKELRDLLK